jgi:hypothetical protein
MLLMQSLSVRMSVRQRTLARSVRALRMHFRVAYSNSHHRYESLIVPEGLKVDFDIIHIDVIVCRNILRTRAG